LLIWWQGICEDYLPLQHWNYSTALVTKSKSTSSPQKAAVSLDTLTYDLWEMKQKCWLWWNFNLEKRFEVDFCNFRF
jgi:hypothetical protein